MACLYRPTRPPCRDFGLRRYCGGISLGAKAGWLGGEALQAAQRCAEELECFIEPDGCLGGVSQHNPAGEVALQEHYRIRAAWGAGLYAQLIAALA